jgi:hypothetical protein
MPVDLQKEIQEFVNTWGPGREHAALRPAFINRLHWLMNEYAKAALAHGNLPEVGMPHRERKGKDAT